MQHTGEYFNALLLQVPPMMYFLKEQHMSTKHFKHDMYIRFQVFWRQPLGRVVYVEALVTLVTCVFTRLVAISAYQYLKAF